MQRVGATEQEKSQAVGLVKQGATLEQVKAAFIHVEDAYWNVNFEDLLILAGKKKAPKGHWTLPPEKEPEAKPEKPTDPLA